MIYLPLCLAMGKQAYRATQNQCQKFQIQPPEEPDEKQRAFTAKTTTRDNKHHSLIGNARVYMIVN